jgi:hypothetical protein
VLRLLEMGDAATLRALVMVSARTTTAPMLLQPTSSRAVFAPVSPPVRAAAAAYVQAVATSSTLADHGRTTTHKGKTRARSGNGRARTSLPAELATALAATAVAGKRARRSASKR